MRRWIALHMIPALKGRAKFIATLRVDSVEPILAVVLCVSVV
jgi:hypothetical protein